MPSSLSQLDTSVLRQLPEDLKADILEQLPQHRRQESCSKDTLTPREENHQESSVIEISEHYPGSSNLVLSEHGSLWAGNPPYWVDKFEVSNSLILKKLAAMYKSGPAGSLSLVLQQTMSGFKQLDLALQSSDETINIMCELLKQYIKVKIERDIEEIYICFRLLKRYADVLVA